MRWLVSKRQLFNAISKKKKKSVQNAAAGWRAGATAFQKACFATVHLMIRLPGSSKKVVDILQLLIYTAETKYKNNTTSIFFKYLH